MSIPSNPSSGGPPPIGTTKSDPYKEQQNKTSRSWQVPKLKVAPPVAHSISPASTPSRTSFSTSYSPPMASQTSFHTSPDGLISFELSEVDKMLPLTLPWSPPDSQPTSPPADPCIGCRPQGLIRRFSRGASNRLRGRASQTNMKSRDHNAGSVVRRRSDSRGVVDGSYDISDLELEDTVEEESVDGYRPLLREAIFHDQRPSPRNLSRRSSEKDGSRLSAVPLKAAVFLKITKRKKKQLRFCLDEASAKIVWSRDASTARKQIYIDDIRELRVGETARNYLTEFLIPEDQLNRWLTIVYIDQERSKGRPIKFKHLLAPDTSTCDQWVNALQHLMKTRDKLMSEMAVNKEKHWLGYWHREMIKRFGTNPHAEEDEKMDFATIRKTCRNFSIYKSDRALRLQFEAVDRHRCGTLNLQQYLEFFRRLTERRDIRRVFDAAVSPEGSTMSFEQFSIFLQTSQMVEVSADADHWRFVFNKFATKRKAQASDLSGRADGLDFEAFRDFLSSSSSSPLKLLRSEPTLDHPINEYFISSSHNTYLEGRQFRGESSPEMYIEALKKGCRCIEIDCENGVDGKPCVTHVKTGTSRASFLDCIKVINQYAFWASDYPLIVSLEVHCNPEQQKIMTENMKTEFGSRLLLQPLLDHQYALPSPEDLKRKILVKVKVAHQDETFLAPAAATAPSTAPPMVHRRQRSSSAPNPRIIQTILPKTPKKTPSIPSPQMSPALHSITLMSSTHPARDYSNSTTTSTHASSSDESDSELGLNTSPKKGRAKSNIVKELGELGVYTRGVKFRDWKSLESKAFNHVYSFNENTFENKCKTPEGKTALEKHNVRCLMRVYPRATRFYSSNFDPLPFWFRGVQMVATNWQTKDLGTQINDAMFAAGTDCTGYVLKPEEMRSRHESGSGRRKKVEKKTVTFSVDIISAQYLEAPVDQRPEAEINPYVEFELYCPEDKSKDIEPNENGKDASSRNGKFGAGSPVRKRTRIVEGNGFDPVFSENETETMTVTVKTKYPSLLFVRWTVWNSPDGRGLSNSKEPLSTFTAKLSSLEEGYRHLPLYNKHGDLLHSKLFCRIRTAYHGEVNSDAGAAETTVEQPRTSEESVKSGKDFLRRVFTRTPSERRNLSRGHESGYFSRTASTERPIA